MDAANRLTDDGTYAYTYDNNGNMISKTNKVTAEITSYSYDAEDRLVSVIPANAGIQSVYYSYDPLGRRIQKNVDGLVTKYIYDNEDIIQEYDSNNNLTASYIHGPGIDEPLILDKAGQRYYYHTDGLGSITAITDSNNNTVQSYQYDSFGNIVNTTGSQPVGGQALTQPYTYTGREYDPETGLYYYRARYYDPKIGRFLSEDPVWDVNLYRYCANPLNWVDPWGLAPGDSYLTKDAAGKTAINDINPTSISQGKEYGGYIYQKSDGTYSYTSPTPGIGDQVDLGPKPSNGKTTGDYHTHGSNDPGYNNEDFSKRDKTGYYGDFNTGYLGTPSGKIKKYDSKSGNVSDITSKKNKERRQRCN